MSLINSVQFKNKGNGFKNSLPIRLNSQRLLPSEYIQPRFTGENSPTNPSTKKLLNKIGRILLLALSVPLIQPATKAIASPPMSKVGMIDEGPGVEQRGDVPITAVSVADLQRKLLVQSIAKGDDPSSVKFFIGPSTATAFKYQDQGAEADSMLFVNQPVDIVITSATSPDTLKTIFSATGKVYSLPGAEFNMGPVEGKMNQAKDQSAQVRRNLLNDYIRDLETSIVQKVWNSVPGLNSNARLFNELRVKVNRDLLRSESMNAIEALAYGKDGLIDGILMDYDRVITREDLNRFYQSNNMDEAAIKEFNRHYINVYKLPKSSLKDVSPKSVSESSDSLYTVPEIKPLETTNKSIPSEKPEDTNRPSFYVNMKNDVNMKKVDLPNILKVSDGRAPKRIFVDKIPQGAQGLIYDDTIFFNHNFQDKTAEEIKAALLALDSKKQKQQFPANIKILVNSPGGSVWSLQELRSVMKSLRTPVDVIVTGMGASCGSLIISSATGNRFVTPNGRIMVHEAANAIPNLIPTDHYNSIQDDLHKATLTCIDMLAEASGRDAKEIEADFMQDVWLNAVESLMYGPKGLADAIYLGDNKIITRQDVEDYMVEKLGSLEKVNEYINQKMEIKRHPWLDTEWKPENHDESDIFDNPLKTIQEVAGRSAKNLTDLDKFRSSASSSDPKRTIDYFSVEDVSSGD